MTRWPVLVVLFVGPLLAGCSPPIVEFGLANAPNLGGTPLADTRVHDAISNGIDACGRHGEQGPLRGQVPPCPTPERPATSSRLAPWPASQSESLVLPWLEHFYTGWPSLRVPPSASTDLALLASSRDPLMTSWSPPAVTDCSAP